ncbi:MAG: hypothetical protein RJQ14_24280 [Marinoscillum sp.]
MKKKFPLVKGNIIRKGIIKICIILSLCLSQCTPSKEECESYISRGHRITPETEKVFFCEMKDRNYVEAVKYLLTLEVSNIGIVSSTQFSDQEIDFFIENNILISKANIKNTNRGDIDVIPVNEYTIESIRFTLAGDNNFVKKFVSLIPSSENKMIDFTNPIVFSQPAELIANYPVELIKQAKDSSLLRIFKNKPILLSSTSEVLNVYDTPFNCLEFSPLNKAELTFNAIYSFCNDESD